MLRTKRAEALSLRANSIQSPKDRLLSIFLKLQEEIGEFATSVNIPTKCTENYVGEGADVPLVMLDAIITLGLIEGHTAEQTIMELNSSIRTKAFKWESYLDSIEKLVN